MATRSLSGSLFRWHVQGSEAKLQPPNPYVRRRRARESAVALDINELRALVLNGRHSREELRIYREVLSQREAIAAAEGQDQQGALAARATLAAERQAAAAEGADRKSRWALIIAIAASALSGGQLLWDIIGTD